MGHLTELTKQAEESKDFFPNAEKAQKTAQELSDLGFDLIASKLKRDAELLAKLDSIRQAGYLKITEEKIVAYVNGLVQAYNLKHKKVASPERVSIASQIEANYQLVDSKWIGQLREVYLSILPEKIPGTFTGESLVTTTGTTEAGIYIDPIAYGNLQQELQTNPNNRFWNDLTAVQSGNTLLTIPIGEPMPTTMKTVPSKNSRRWRYVAPTIHACSTDSDKIGKLIWDELPIEEVDKLPPPEVIEKLKDAKGKHLFDYFTIGRIKSMPDPLLFGRVEGVTDRWFIAQYDAEVAIEDLL